MKVELDFKDYELDHTSSKAFTDDFAKTFRDPVYGQILVTRLPNNNSGEIEVNVYSNLPEKKGIFNASLTFKNDDSGIADSQEIFDEMDIEKLLGLIKDNS